MRVGDNVSGEVVRISLPGVEFIVCRIDRRIALGLRAAAERRSICRYEVSVPVPVKAEILTPGLRPVHCFVCIVESIQRIIGVCLNKRMSETGEVDCLCQHIPIVIRRAVSVVEVEFVSNIYSVAKYVYSDEAFRRGRDESSFALIKKFNSKKELLASYSTVFKT